MASGTTLSPQGGQTDDVVIRAQALRTPLAWLVPLRIGFAIGGVLGALAAGKASDAALQWAYVAYLSALVAVMTSALTKIDPALLIRIDPLTRFLPTVSR